MGIDGIGSRGPVPPAPGPAPAGATGGPKATFEVDGAAGATRAAEVKASPALERVRSGQMTVDGYLDAKVDEATAHLRALPAAKLEAIRAALRERLSSDPTLADLVRTATGQSPPKLDDG